MAVSIREVAAAAGVSVGTVSNVLNRPDSVAEATTRRVRAAIDELGYVRNDAARQLRAGRSSTVGLIVLDARNPFFTDLSMGAEDEAAQRRLSVLLGNSDERPERERAYLAFFEEQRVRGVLVSPIAEDLGGLRRLRERGIPVVLVDRAAPGSGFSSVAVDDLRGGELAARHLIDAGRRRLAFLGGPAGLRQVADRLAGARRAVEATPGASLEVIETGSPTVLAGREAVERILARERSGRPDGVFAANDLLAMGVLQAIVMNGGVEVPGEIALIGYDDIDFAAAAAVPLSSVRQPARLIGQTAVDILCTEADDPGAEPRHVVFEPELIPRASTTP